MIRFLLLATRRHVQQHFFKTLLQIFAVALATSLVLSVIVSGRESIAAFDSLSRVSKKSWKYEIRHISGTLPAAFLSYVAQSNMQNIFVAQERVETVGTQQLRILSVLMSDRENNSILADYPNATCLVKEGIVYSCSNQAAVKNLPYDVIRARADDDQATFIALFDEYDRSKIEALPQYFSGLIVESKDDKFSRAANITFAYRSNLDFLILLSVFLTSFVVFSCALHGYVQTKKTIITLRTLGVSSAGLLFFSSLESILIGMLGSIVGLTILAPLTEFLARAYFVSTQAHHQGSLNLPSFQPHYITDIPIVLIVSMGASFLGTLLPTLSILRTLPSLSPKEDELHAVPFRTIQVGALLFVILAPLSMLLASHLSFLPLTYLSALMLFFGSGICSLLLMGPLAAAFASLTSRFHPTQSLSGAFFAARSLAHEPFRFGLSAFAFGAAFAFLVSLHIFVDSFRITLEKWMNATFHGSLYLRDDAGTMPASVIQSLQKEQQLLWLLETKEIDVPFEQGRIKMYLVPLDIVERNNLYNFIGERSPTGDLFVSEVAKAKFTLSLGQQVTLFGTLFTIKGFYRDFANERGAFLVDYDTYLRKGLPTITTKTVTASFQDDQITQAALHRLEALKIPSLVSFNASTLKQEALRIFDDTFRITTYIELLVFLVCIINFALIFLHDIEIRTRQYGTLRLIGFAPRDFIMTISTMALLILASSAISGAFFGVLLGSTIVNQINPLSFGWTIDFLLAPQSLLIPIAFGACTIFLVLPLIYRPMKTRIAHARVSLE